MLTASPPALSSRGGGGGPVRCSLLLFLPLAVSLSLNNVTPISMLDGPDRHQAMDQVEVLLLLLPLDQLGKLRKTKVINVLIGCIFLGIQCKKDVEVETHARRLTLYIGPAFGAMVSVECCNSGGGGGGS